MHPSPGHQFAKYAKARDPNIIGEVIDFLRHNKKWWMLPILVSFSLFGVLVALGGSGAAPFIYALF